MTVVPCRSVITAQVVGEDLVYGVKMLVAEVR